MEDFITWACPGGSHFNNMLVFVMHAGMGVIFLGVELKQEGKPTPVLNGPYWFSAFRSHDHSDTHYSPIHSATCLSETSIHTHSSHSYRSNLGVKSLAQGHSSTWLSRAWDPTVSDWRTTVAPVASGSGGAPDSSVSTHFLSWPKEVKTSKNTQESPAASLPPTAYTHLLVVRVLDRRANWLMKTGWSFQSGGRWAFDV